MGFLIDTNVISELRKRDDCAPAVLSWFREKALEELYLSVMTTGEIRRGLERHRLKDEAQARQYERWLHGLEMDFKSRILPVTAEIADIWGYFSGRLNLPLVDGLIAATARYHGHTVVSRNERDFQRSGVDYLNPFERKRP